MNTLDTAQLIALAGALGWASGVRLYLVVLLTGLAGFMGWVDLPAGLQLLSNPVVLGVSGFMVAPTTAWARSSQPCWAARSPPPALRPRPRAARPSIPHPSPSAISALHCWKTAWCRWAYGWRLRIR
jgi:hypothetical protein